MNIFKLEMLRDKMAGEGDFEQFFNSYRRGLPEIPNRNTGRMWDRLNTEVITERLNPMAWNRSEYVSRLVKRGRVLDLGFGSGILEKMLINVTDVDLVGIDMSAKSVKVARESFKRWKFYVGDITKLPKKLGTFSTIILLEVLEHIPPSKVLALLRKIFLILEQGGTLIVSVPLNEPLEEMIKSGRNINAHVRSYTPNIIKAELIISGFEISKEKYFYAYHHFYKLKSVIGQLLRRKPNNIVLIAKKP